MKRLLIISGICTIIGMVVLVRRFMYGEVFSDKLLAQLKPGMGTNDVMAIVGPPSDARSEQWFYYRPFMYNIGIVNFDESGRLLNAFND